MRDGFSEDHRLFADVPNFTDNGARPDSLQQLFDSQVRCLLEPQNPTPTICNHFFESCLVCLDLLRSLA